ncbi:kinase-like domain-containing protein [Ephemerocybe angulata]|uniref:Kinase-like domain-containing protein n=1 Tax=Ephemerocybe angulata TaxID=980116 RepID=A0A8H6M2U1_9AGAR|nr:kinase-like domain-containing protein [Tulosesus angulatus]
MTNITKKHSRQIGSLLLPVRPPTSNNDSPEPANNSRSQAKNEANYRSLPVEDPLVSHPLGTAIRSGATQDWEVDEQPSESEPAAARRHPIPLDLDSVRFNPTRDPTRLASTTATSAPRGHGVFSAVREPTDDSKSELSESESDGFESDGGSDRERPNDHSESSKNESPSPSSDRSTELEDGDAVLLQGVERLVIMELPEEQFQVLEMALDIVSTSSTTLSIRWPSPAASWPHRLQNAKQLDLARIFLDISRDRVAAKALVQLEDELAQAVLDGLQMVLDSDFKASSSRTNWNPHLQILQLLLRLAKYSARYPSRLLLSGISRVGHSAVTAGHFGEIWKGRYRGKPVCVKVVKLYQRSDINKLLRGFSREAILWSHLKHENVLAFYGIHRLDDEAGRMCLISPWMENGNVGDYLSRSPTADRRLLARDVCHGLSYLHAQGIIHGDLKGVNILVTQAGRACVADFGLSFVADSEIMKWTATTSAGSQGGTVRWQAPELFSHDAESSKATKLTDIYSLGCVFYEIFTGRIPFYEVPRDATVMYHILAGKQPSRPAPGTAPFSHWGLSDALWTSCIQRCWARVPEARPTILQLLSSPVLETPLGTSAGRGRAIVRRQDGLLTFAQ